MANPIGRLTASVISSARPARAAPPRRSLDPRSTSLPAESMSIANPSAENAGKGWDAGAITCSQVLPRIAPAISSPTKTGANGLLPAANNGPSRPARTSSVRDVNIDSYLLRVILPYLHRPERPIVLLRGSVGGAERRPGHRRLPRARLFIYAAAPVSRRPRPSAGVGPNRPFSNGSTHL